MREFSFILQSDSNERVRVIMQYVEKRIVRFNPPQILTNLHIVAFGMGTSGWGQYKTHPVIETDNWAVTPWPSERNIMGLPSECVPIRPGCEGKSNACVGTIPHMAEDTKFLIRSLRSGSPIITVFECHPSLGPRIFGNPMV